MAFIVIGLCQLFTLIKFHLLLLLLTEYLNSVSFKKAGILRAKGMDNKFMFMRKSISSLLKIKIIGWKVWTLLVCNKPIKIKKTWLFNFGYYVPFISDLKDSLQIFYKNCSVSLRNDQVFMQLSVKLICIIMLRIIK